MKTIKMKKQDKDLNHQRRKESIKRRIYLSNIGNYLLKLNFLTGTTVTRDDLLSLDFSWQLSKKKLLYEEYPLYSEIIPFKLKNSLFFELYINNLFIACEEQIYIYIENTLDCGLYKAKNIKSINYSFDFDFEENGVITFVTVDGNNKLLLDYEIDSNGSYLLNIEAQGKEWSVVKFPIIANEPRTSHI